MPDVAVIGGTHLLRSSVFPVKEVKHLKTPHGEAEVHITQVSGREVPVIRRHRDGTVPPHMVNHSANMHALRDLGVRYVIGMSSAGCLHSDVRLPCVMIPHDYMDFFSGATAVESETKHITPGFDEPLRQHLIRAAREAAGIDVLTRGVYFQTRGPRLETKAEVAFIKTVADAVGMTVGAEATVAVELDLRYAALCTLDNYANGITEEPLRYEDIVRNAERSSEAVARTLKKALEVGSWRF